MVEVVEVVVVVVVVAAAELLECPNFIIRGK